MKLYDRIVLFSAALSVASTGFVVIVFVVWLVTR